MPHIDLWDGYTNCSIYLFKVKLLVYTSTNGLFINSCSALSDFQEKFWTFILSRFACCFEFLNYVDFVTGVRKNHNEYFIKHCDWSTDTIFQSTITFLQLLILWQLFICFDYLYRGIFYQAPRTELRRRQPEYIHSNKCE